MRAFHVAQHLAKTSAAWKQRELDIFWVLAKSPSLAWAKAKYVQNINKLTAS